MTVGQIIALFSIPILLWGYGFITTSKRFIYNIFNLRKESVIPTLVVGNLNVGGSGKTPMILFLLENFQNLKFGVLSRGYGRKTKGYQNVDIKGNSIDYGDEPLEIKNAHPNNPVSVCEDRLSGIQTMKQEVPSLDAVILDDGFQHLRLRPNKSVLLTTYQRPFFNEMFTLPIGDLREFAFASKHADAVVITKCPAELTKEEAQEFSKKIDVPKGKLFYAHYRQTSPQMVMGEEVKAKKAVFISGVAGNPTFEIPGWDIVESFNYADHQSFTLDIVQGWLKTCKKHNVNLLLLTRKDWNRIRNTHIIKILSESFITIYETHTEVEVLWNQKEELLQLLKPC